MSLCAFLHVDGLLSSLFAWDSLSTQVLESNGRGSFLLSRRRPRAYTGDYLVLTVDCSVPDRD